MRHFTPFARCIKMDIKRIIITHAPIPNESVNSELFSGRFIDAVRFVVAKIWFNICDMKYASIS